MHDQIAILIADDHPIFRDGLRGLIESERGFILSGEAVDGEQALDLTRKLKPDILLLDLAMPKLGGLEVVKQLARPPIPTRIMLLTAAIDDAQITEALRFGARGVVLKDTATQLLVKSIRCVVAGEFWVGRRNVQGLVQALQMAQMTQPEDPVKKYALTAREMEVLTAIVEGYSNKEIAKKFSISEQTVKHHLSSIFTKVGVSNRLELALFSVHHQLVGKRS
ncbi:MAG: DNA-binding response regulator [Acidobacteria bacterium]|nr:MAG: DNA-binding response regulator [Acidobacteriota bacterium]